MDTRGNILDIKVRAANIHDTKSGLEPAKEALSNYPSIQKICAVVGYRGTFVDEIKEKFQIDVDIVKRTDSGKWRILPKRWIVERTFALINNYRRMSKDYEFNISSAESMIKIANSYTFY